MNDLHTAFETVFGDQAGQTPPPPSGSADQIKGEIETAVTAALKSADGTTDLDQVVQQAIESVLSQSQNASTTTGTTDTTVATGTAAAATTGTTTMSGADFIQLLASYGVSQDDFANDLKTAFTTVLGDQTPSPDVTSTESTASVTAPVTTAATTAANTPASTTAAAASTTTAMPYSELTTAIQTAVAATVQSAPSTADLNEAIQNAIENVLKSQGDFLTSDGSNSTTSPGEFAQMLSSYGITASQFQNDLKAAFQGAQTVNVTV
jgi:DNA-binding transcriptional regulator YiaG